MATKSPLLAVKEAFGDKKKLIEAVKAFQTEELWLGRMSSDRGGSKGLARVSNAKLLRLHETFKAVKDKYGSRAKLIGTILEIEKRTKDEGYKARLESFPVPRLFDHLKSAEKRAKAAEKKG